MLLILPACFAAGFCLGYWRARVPVNPQTTLVVLLVGIVVVLTIALTSSTPEAWSGKLLGIAGVIVGALAGAWYANDSEDKRSRDKSYFIAGAGGFLFLSALEYDHRLFDKLSKIGGGGVSFEFAAQNATPRGNESITALAQSQDYTAAAFPGASALTFAIGFYDRFTFKNRR